ncbi:PD-(D/E)XK nuclease family protein [Jeotgalicoccus marinus]|uniref:PD-(D/E)XK nuclease family protein n=1 Tax=Jeotgalicoccus marinus TaxID=516700 RepID=UPI00042A47D5|nr:PD-(D/E)XK nuclease family protein [Jeotgalicoccus marinus]
MTITIWTGTSGTGKTNTMFEEIYKKTKDDPLGSSIYIITPTQNTLTYEQLIARQEDGMAGGSMRTGVYSFSRLMWHVYNELGQPTKNVLSEAGHIMLIHKLMNDIKDKLKYYHTSQGYIKFSEKVLDQITEFKAYNIETKHLLDLKFSKGRTTEKYEDLAIIYQRWQEEIESYKVEDLNMIPHFIESIKEANSLRTLKDAVIYIDGFHNFTESEFALIYALEQEVGEINLLLTHRKSDGYQGLVDIDLFRKTEAVISRLQELFGENYLNFRHFNQEFLRAKNSGLSQLELFITTGQPMTNYDGITITESPSPEEEIREVARNIETLVRNNEARYADIGILYRDQSYENIFKSIFKQFNIAYHMDMDHFMHCNPFTELVIALLDCYQSRFQRSAFINVLKTGYLNRTKHDEMLVMHLENIIIERGLTGGELFDDKRFTIEYKLGIEGDIETIDNTEALSEMIQYKNSKLHQLQRLFNQLDQGETAQDFVETIYQYIVDEGIEEKVANEIKELTDTNIRLANETEQAYNLFIRLLDDSYTVFKDEKIEFSLFYDTFTEGLKRATFNTRPAAVDQVIIGLLDLAKVENKKYVFIVGMNYNVMPQESRNTAIVTDDEKEVLEDRGIILSPSARTLSRDEKFVFYMGISQPTNHLFISWSTTLQNKEVTKLSPFVEAFLPMDESLVLNYSYRKTAHYELHNTLGLISSVRSMEALEHHKLRTLMTYDLEEFTRLVRLPQYNNFIGVYHLLKNKTNHTVLNRLNRNLTYLNRAEDIREETAIKLYGDEMRASVSRFQSYFSCHFQHFSNYGMKLNVRQNYTVRPLEIGNLYHNALEQITKRLDMTLKHDDEVIKKAVVNSVDNVLRTISYGIFERSEYFLSLKEKAISAITTTLMFMKDLEYLGDYQISLIEATFGKKSDDLGELVLESENGKKIYLRGKIDRVDTYNNASNVYVNIIDYKSSDRKLKKEDVLNGVELQIITYMYVLMNRAKTKLGGDIVPNAMMFYHVNEPKVRVDDEEEALKLKQNKLRPDGLFVIDGNDLSSNTGMDHMIEEEKLSEYLPLKLKKDGSLDKNSAKRTMSSEMFAHYSNFVMEQFKTATDEIYSGRTLANPLEHNNRLPCAFCDFKAACHIDKLINEHDYRKNKITDEDIEAFESEVNNG